MNFSKDQTDQNSHLRLIATSRIEEGTAPQSNNFVSENALSFLHELANEPSTAEFALTLLHELQVHQVELDLQREQHEDHSRDIEESLNHYKSVYQSVPFACFVINADGTILEGNNMAYRLFNLEPSDMNGRIISSFVAPESRLAFLRLQKRILDDSQRESGNIIIRNKQTRLKVIANKMTNVNYYLLSLVDFEATP